MPTQRMLAIQPAAVNIVAPLIPADGSPNPIRVTARSPLARRRAVFQTATFFRREFGYDFTPYGWDGREDDPDHNAFLWVHPEAVGFGDDFRVPVIGACCFRLRDESAPRWGLQWVWFHPYFRRRGLLTRAWPKLRSEFGDFDVEAPLSDAMRAFLSRYATKG